MDAIPGSKENRPRTAVEEAMNRIADAMTHGAIEYKQLSFFSFKKRFYLQGSLITLKLVFAMLHELAHKYDNQTGEWN